MDSLRYISLQSISHNCSILHRHIYSVTWIFGNLINSVQPSAGTIEWSILLLIYWWWTKSTSVFSIRPSYLRVCCSSSIISHTHLGLLTKPIMFPSQYKSTVDLLTTVLISTWQGLGILGATDREWCFSIDDNDCVSGLGDIRHWDLLERRASLETPPTSPKLRRLWTALSPLLRVQTKRLNIHLPGELSFAIVFSLLLKFAESSME